MDVTISSEERLPDLLELLYPARDLIGELWETPQPPRDESGESCEPQPVSYRGLRVAMAIVLAIRDRKDILACPAFEGNQAAPISAEGIRDFIAFSAGRVAGIGIPEPRDWRNKLMSRCAQLDFARLQTLAVHIGRTEDAIVQLCVSETLRGCNIHYGLVDGSPAEIAVRMMGTASEKLLTGPVGLYAMRTLQALPDARLPFALTETRRILAHLVSAHADVAESHELARIAIDVAARLYA